MEFSINEIVKDHWGNKGVITKIEEDDTVYVLWKDGSCGLAKVINLYKTGKRVDITYFLSILGKR